MSNIKSQIKQLHVNLEKDILRMEQYYTNKSESWQYSDAGDKYEVRLGVLRELLEATETAICDLGIKLKR